MSSKTNEVSFGNEAISQLKSSEISQGTPTSQVTIVENKKSNLLMTTQSRPPLALTRKPKEVRFFFKS